MEQIALKSVVIDHLDLISDFCGVDIFLLGPKFTSLADAQSITGDPGHDQRWRVAIYGDMESTEHAKTRVLIFIDRLVSLKSGTFDMSYPNSFYSLAEWSMVRC